ncbi:DNA-directed RNA polymerase I subunit RPA12-like [Teleopsis dalmanni]|uniref:DNA-directed RNA polymerase I subunit RPA12-like n=1 Tax=Teleopsis dalmanni TaxID=139649 RepID=UPI000D32D1EB|nr:DNA-directed RNA polymerase I subunit RPA12-like [Teleopsis dalmanni]XP_037952510.1 DNA-directed RNA polymerase I subunit RPA12-like [Teleopsis dalmanni]
MDMFKTHPGFCPTCGSIFPPLRPTENVTCYNCKKVFSPDVLGEQEIEYTIHFNTYDPKKLSCKPESVNKSEEPSGPIVERKCSQCGHDKMSYATLQLRSADEGQTVFFTCLKCRFKESENS